MSEALRSSPPRTSPEVPLEDERKTDGEIVQLDTLPTQKAPIQPGAGDAPQSAFAQLSPNQAILTFRRLFAMGLFTSIGAMYVGYTASAIGNVVANIGFIEQFGTVIQADGTLALRAQYVSIWGAVQSASQIFFQAISPFVIDNFGRKSAMYGLTVFVLLEILLGIFARDWKVYLAAKLFAGAASGWLGPSLMAYLSEISLPQFRGAILGGFSLFYAVGGFTNAVAAQIIDSNTPHDYRRLFYSEFFYLGVWLFPVFFLPESPAWLVIQGKEDKAKRSLRKLVGNGVAGYDHDFEFEVFRQDILTSLEITRSYSNNSWAALFKWGNFKRCIASALPFAAQQFAGVPYLFGYTTYFFQLAGLSNPFLSTVIIQVIYVMAIILSFFLIDRIGRRPLLLGRLGSLTVINTLIGALGFINGTNSSLGSALTALCAIWMFAYSISLAPIGWIGIVEVSSVQLRAKTAAFGVLINSFVGLVFNYTVPLLLSDQDAGWGVKIGLFFGGLSLISIPPIYFLYPETKGRTYAELDELFERNIPPRKFKTTVTALQSQIQTENA